MTRITANDIARTLTEKGPMTRQALSDWLGRPYGLDRVVHEMERAGTVVERSRMQRSGFLAFELHVVGAVIDPADFPA